MEFQTNAIAIAVSNRKVAKNMLQGLKLSLSLDCTDGPANRREEASAEQRPCVWARPYKGGSEHLVARYLPTIS